MPEPFGDGRTQRKGQENGNETLVGGSNAGAKTGQGRPRPARKRRFGPQVTLETISAVLVPPNPEEKDIACWIG